MFIGKGTIKWENVNNIEYNRMDETIDICQKQLIFNDSAVYYALLLIWLTRRILFMSIECAIKALETMR